MSTRQVEIVVRTAGPVLLIEACLLAALGWYSWGSPLDVGDLTRDPASLVGAPFYTGALSTLGIMIWSASAAFCWIGASTSGGASRGFLRFAGGLSAALAVDDAFLIHDVAGPEALGVPGPVFLAAYGAAAAWLLIRWRGLILETDHGLLHLAVLLLSASVVVDVAHDELLLLTLGITSEGLKFLAEDGTKLLGITTWAIYFARTSAAAGRRTGASPPTVNRSKRPALGESHPEESPR